MTTPNSILEAKYLIHEVRSLKPASRRSYGKVIEKFFIFLTKEGVDLQMPIAELQEVYFLKFAEALLPREVSSREDISHLRTATHNLTVIRHWLKLLEASQMHPAFCRKCFYAKLTAMTPRADIPKVVVDMDELERFVEFVRKLDQPTKGGDVLRLAKIRAIISFLQETGVRVSEVACLYKRDIDLRDRTAKIYQRKGRDITVFFSPETASLLCCYWELRGDGENSRGLPAFSGVDSPRRVQRHISSRTVEHYITTLSAEAGVKNITPHTFRHAVKRANKERSAKERTYQNSP